MPYTIQRGDTLGRLAQQWGTTVQDIMKANPYIKDPNVIYAGKTLVQPGQVAPAAAPIPAAAPAAAPAATPQQPASPIADFTPSQFPYEAQLQELLQQMPQWQPQPPEEQLGLAQQYAGLHIDPQIQRHQQREQELAQQQMASAVARGVARGGAPERYEEQRREYYDPIYQDLEAQRGALTTQHLAQLEAQQHARGMEGWQNLMGAMETLTGHAQAWDANQWQRALDTYARTMLTPLEQLHTHLGYTEALGEIPEWMIDPYGGRGPAATEAGAPRTGGTYTIQRGDTLGRLAQQWGTTVDALMRANPQIKDPNVIITGQTLQRP